LNTNNEQSHKKKDLLNWRREKILLFSSQGFSQRDIADKIKVSVGTVNKDITFLREQAKENIKNYVDETLPEEYEKCLTGLNSILREAWITVSSSTNNTTDKREKIQALLLAKECYSMKLDLLTNANVVNDVIRFISSSTNKNKNNNILTQSNTKKESSTGKKIINDNIESNDQIKTIDGNAENNKNIIENRENDLQGFTEDNNSTGKSTYNSIF
jgi:hypothetical protein